MRPPLALLFARAYVAYYLRRLPSAVAWWFASLFATVLAGLGVMPPEPRHGVPDWRSCTDVLCDGCGERAAAACPHFNWAVWLRQPTPVRLLSEWGVRRVTYLVCRAPCVAAVVDTACGTVRVGDVYESLERGCVDLAGVAKVGAELYAEGCASR